MTALLHSGVSVAGVLARFFGVLRQRPGLLLATAALAGVDVGPRDLPLRRPVPTARRRLPVVRFGFSQRQRPIIVTNDASIAETIPFPPGSKLVMFTDGLVERPPIVRCRSQRGGDLPRRTSRAAHAERSHRCRARRALRDGVAEDDVAIW